MTCLVLSRNIFCMGLNPTSDDAMMSQSRLFIATFDLRIFFKARVREVTGECHGAVVCSSQISAFETQHAMMSRVLRLQTRFIKNPPVGRATHEPRMCSPLHMFQTAFAGT